MSKGCKRGIHIRGDPNTYPMEWFSTSQVMGDRAEVKVVGGDVMEPKGYCVKKITDTPISSENEKE